MSNREGMHRRRWWIGAVFATLLVLIAGSVAVVAVVNGDPARVRLEPAAAPGPNPFTESVASGPPAAIVATVRAKSDVLRTTLPSDRRTHTLIATGTVPGLYGGSGDVSVCDAQKLVTFLAKHQGKAAAWARVQGIAPKNIGSFVAKLIPVVLNSDTLVGNHGYRDGSATAFQSVLQTGTAVMVDTTGTPRVKCNCGNPLTPPKLITLSTATVIGTAWPGYAPQAVTAVRPGKATGMLTLVNVTTGVTYDQGTSAESGGLWVAAEIADSAAATTPTTIMTSADGRQWRPIAVIPAESVSGLVWGDGRWIAVAHRGSYGSDQTDVLESRDLHSWQRLATIPDRLTGIAYGSGRWVAVGTPPWRSMTAGGTPPKITGVIYTSTDATRWDVATTITDATRSHPLDGTFSIGYGNGKWIAVASSSTPTPALFSYESNNGTDWTSQNNNVIPAESVGMIGYGAGQWVVVASSPANPADTAAPPSGAVSLSSDGVLWKSYPNLVPRTLRFTAVAYGRGHWLAATGGSSLSGIPPTFLGSSDARTWSRLDRITATEVTAIGFGGAATAGSAPTTQPSAGGQLEDGRYALSLPAGTGCFENTLDGREMTVHGNMATMTNSIGVLFAGPIDQQGANVTVKLAGGPRSSSGPVSGSTTITLTATVGKGGTLTGTGNNSGIHPGGETGYTCDFTFTATRTGGGATPNAAAPGGDRDCTVATMLPVINSSRPAGNQLTLDPGQLRCDGTWAVAGPVDHSGGGDAVTVVLHVVGGAWTTVPRNASCSGHEIPASLMRLACESN